MFVLVNPAETLSEREKHLRTSLIRSHTATFEHSKRKHRFVSHHFYNAPNERHTSPTHVPTRPFLSASTLRPRAPLIAALKHQHEVESVHYLFECGLPHIAGLDDREFWHVTMIPLMSSNSSLQYTVAALGIALRAWHLQRRSGSTQWTTEERWRHLKSSNVAFRQLMSENNIPLLTLLAACILFTTLSMLANELHEARQHITHGIAILNEWSAHRSESSSLKDRAIEESILPVFHSLSTIYGTMQYIKDSSGEGQLIWKRDTTLVQNSTIDTLVYRRSEGFGLIMPDSFSSILMSGQWQRKLAKTFTAQLGQPLTSAFTDIATFRDAGSLLRAKTLLQAWRSRYDKFLRTHTHKLNKIARAAAHHQNAYFHYLFIQLDTMFCADEMAFDQYESSFRVINAACRSLLALGTEEGSSIQPQRPTFRVESYIMQLLSFTAHHCRHPLVRRQTIELLESNHLEECHTPAGNFAAWSRLLIKIEERNCQHPPQASADIPSQQRVRSMEMTQLPPRPRPRPDSRHEALIDAADHWLVDEGEGRMTIRLDGRPVECKPPTTWQGHAGGSVRLQAYSAMIYSTGQFPQQP